MQPTTETQEQKLIRYQTTVIEHLVGLTKRQDARLDVLEALVAGGNQPKRPRTPPDTVRHCDADNPEPPRRRQRTPATSLSTSWYDWYCREPRLRDAKDKRQRKSDVKLIVAYMKLFLDNMVLETTSSRYYDVSMALGTAAERSVVRFLQDRSITATGSQSVLKHMCALHKAGELNTLISLHKRHLAADSLVDSSPRFTQDILELVPSASRMAPDQFTPSRSVSNTPQPLAQSQPQQSDSQRDLSHYLQSSPYSCQPGMLMSRDTLSPTSRDSQSL